MDGKTASGPRRLTIGRLSRHTGCHLETIRYYERIGLLPPPPRTAGGHRVYGEADVGRLGFIRRARELGFSVAEVRSLLQLVDGRAYTCAEVEALTRAHLSAVRDKLRDLRRLERVLAQTVARCDGRAAPQCPVIDALLQR